MNIYDYADGIRKVRLGIEAMRDLAEQLRDVVTDDYGDSTDAAVEANALLIAATIAEGAIPPVKVMS